MASAADCSEALRSGTRRELDVDWIHYRFSLRWTNATSGFYYLWLPVPITSMVPPKAEALEAGKGDQERSVPIACPSTCRCRQAGT